MRSPSHYIAAQEQLFAKFKSRSIPIQQWSKYLMTPKELALLFQKLEKSNSVLQDIANKCGRYAFTGAVRHVCDVHVIRKRHKF